MATIPTFTYDVALPTALDYVRSRSDDYLSSTLDGTTNTPWFVANETIQAWLNDGNNENEVAAMVCESMATRISQMANEVTQVDLKVRFLDRAQQLNTKADQLRTKDRSTPESTGQTGAGFGWIRTPELRDYPNLLPGQCGHGVGSREDW